MTYKAMCDDERIQGLWVPKAGDWTNKGLLATPLGMKVYTESGPCGFLRKNLTWRPSIENMVGWLHGDKFQEGKKFQRLFYFALDQDTRQNREWMKDKGQPLPRMMSNYPDELVLAFAMHELHALTWAGEWK